jgi:hypothetical protein
MVLEMLPIGQAGYGCKNRKPRYRHNPDRWLGGNHHRYDDLPDCHRGKHYGMPGKSTLNRRIELLMPPRPAQFYEPSAAISSSERDRLFFKTQGGEFMLQRLGLATHVSINSLVLSIAHEKTVIGTLW